MKSLLVMLVLLLASCGSQTEYVRSAQDFEGVFYFSNGGRIELIASADNEITILRSMQSITTLNPKNSTLGSHPIVVKENLEVYGDNIFFTINVNYGTNAQYDIEEDVSGADITGSRRTDFRFERTVTNSLRLTISIYANKINSNVNSVVARRVLESI